MIRLSISEQGQAPRLVTFNKPAIVLGRTPACDLALGGKGVSSQHCRVMEVPGGIVVEDLGSTNGTYVNRVRIAAATPVTAADEIVFAVYQVRVIEEAAVRTGMQPVTGTHAAAGGPSTAVPSGAHPVASTPGAVPMPQPPGGGSMPPPGGGAMPPPGGGAMPPPGGDAMPPPGGGSRSTTGVMPVGAAFDDARWVREWERLDKLAAEWIASGRDRTRLLRGDKLAHARSWLEQGRGRQPLPKREHTAFIQAAANAARLRVARNVTLAGVVLGLGGVAAWRLAPETIDAPEPDAPSGGVATTGAESPPLPETPIDDGARADALVATAEAVLTDDADLAGLLAVAALGDVGRDEDLRGSSAEQLLRRALREHRGRPLRGHGASLAFVAMSPDGRWVVSVDGGAESSVAQLWDLDRAGLAAPQKLRGQIGTIRALAFAPDGGSIVTGGDDEEIWRWDLRQSPPTPQTIAAPEGGIVALAWSDDARWLVAGGRSGRARLIDLGTPGAKPALLEGHTGSITAVDVDATGSRVATASQDGSAQLWRIAAGAPTGKPTRLEGHMGAVLAVAISPDHRWVLTGGADNVAKLWDTTARVMAPRDFTAHGAAVQHVAFAPDARLAITASADGTATVWKLTVPEPELAGLSDGRGKGKGEITALQVRGPAANETEAGKRPTWAVLAAADGSVRTLDPTKIDKTIDGNEIAAHTAGSVALGVDGRGAFAASGGADAVVRIWDLAARVPGGLSRVGRGDGEKVFDMAMNAAGTRVLTGGDDGTARLWEVGERPQIRALATMPVHRGRVAVAISPNGQYGATASEDGIVRLWRADGSDPEPAHQAYSGHTAEVNDLVFGPDGAVLVSVSNDKTARVWRMTEDPAKDVVVLRHADLVMHAALGPQSRWLITATIRQLNLWDLADPAPDTKTLELVGHDADIRCVAISPDGRWAASGDANDRVVLWDLTAPDVKQLRLKAHAESVDALAFSPDGRWLASAGRDRSVVVWRLTSKHPEDDPITLMGHRSGIGKLVWSADGKWLYSGDNEGAVWAWPVESTDPIAGAMVLDGHSDVLSGLSVVADGSALATSSYDGAVRMWPLHPEGLRALACAMIGRDLTAEESATHLGGRRDPVCD